MDRKMKYVFTQLKCSCSIKQVTQILRVFFSRGRMSPFYFQRKNVFTCAFIYLLQTRIWPTTCYLHAPFTGPFGECVEMHRSKLESVFAESPSLCFWSWPQELGQDLETEENE